MSYAQDAIDIDKAFAPPDGQRLTVSRYAPTRNAVTGDVTKGAATQSASANAIEVPVTQAVIGTFAATLVPGELVNKTIRTFKVSALLGFQPAAQDEVTLADGSVWPVIGCTTVNPAGVPLVYTVGVAK